MKLLIASAALVYSFSSFGADVNRISNKEYVDQWKNVAVEQMLANDKNMYCRKFIDQNPNLVSYIDVQNDHFTVDIDTIEDIENFNQKTGWSLTLPKGTLPAATLPEMALNADSHCIPSQHDAQADSSHHQANAEPAYLALRRKLTPH